MHQDNLSELTDSQGIQLEYWSGFNAFLKASLLKLKTPETVSAELDSIWD